MERREKRRGREGQDLESGAANIRFLAVVTERRKIIVALIR